MSESVILHHLPSALAARHYALCLLVLAVLGLPFVVSGYVLLLLTTVLIYSVAIMGLNLLTGFGGQISLGHGAFYGLGAYVAASMMSMFGFPYWIAVPSAGILCFVFGYLFGIPANRLTGPYLALVTFAFALALPQLLKYQGLEALTGGVQGLAITKPSVPAGMPLTEDQWIYLHTLLWMIALFVFARNLMTSQLGMSIIAVRDNPTAAAAMGVDVKRMKSSLFALSALYAGIAGALGAIAAQFVSPDGFSALLSISLLVGLVVGGSATISGPIIGATFITFVPNLTDQISKGATGIIYALLLLAIVFFMPSGIAGLRWRISRTAK
jgi:branched-chain amino acid transport system permease protein